jgi:glucosamine-6-phosphate isomerase
MRIVEVNDYHEMSEWLVREFSNQLRKKPDSILSFTTGKTPMEFLERMAVEVNNGLDISESIFLNLDEYVGRKTLPCSVYGFMHRYFYDRISVQPKLVDMFQAEAPDQQEELKRYGEVLRKYPRDVQLLGLGTNGHIGANEPGTSFHSKAFVADSVESTIEATRKLFDLQREETPTQMYTMGFTEIMEAEHIILAASGESKARAVKALVEGEITEEIPASFLRTHRNVTLLIDRDAGSMLEKKGWNFIATWKMAESGIKKGQKTYSDTKDIHRAVIDAIKVVENTPDYHSVGYGGLPNCNGEVELDAAFMDGNHLRAGGVMAVKNVQNPIEAAYLLTKQNRNNFLAGEGAEEFCREKKLAFSNMLTAEAEKQYQIAKESGKEMMSQEAYDGHDTVCVIGRDEKNSLCCGVSTSGLFLKHPGRVGDSPIIGSGFYADSEIGAAAATGVGEDIMRGCLAFAILEQISAGKTVQEACENVLRKHMEKLQKTDGNIGSISVIAMDKNGTVGAATNLPVFPFVVGNTEGICRMMAVCPGKDGMQIFEPTGEWWKNYQVD